MRNRKHKRKINHFVIVTSDAVDGVKKSYRYGSATKIIIIVVLCIVFGGSIGYFVNEAGIMNILHNSFDKQTEFINDQNEKITELENTISDKDTQIAELQAEINDLQEQNELVSQALNSVTESEAGLKAELEKQSIPSEFPLTGPATMDEETGTEPICIFTTSAGTNVVATANGTVTQVNDDAVYGKNVWIDHGNGYITIYRNAGDPAVGVGDTVVAGTTLFTVGDDNVTLGYQMLLDGEYINPCDLMAISG